MEAKRPIITLLTDFGETDGYVAAMKGVILSACPYAQIVDVTHGIPPQDIQAAAWVLAQYWNLYPEGTIHVGVVDPGVGSQRRALILEVDRQYLVVPDNGLAALAVRMGRDRVFRCIHSQWHRPGVQSATFHGRDVFAYAAALLAEDAASIEKFTERVPDIVMPEWVLCRRKENAVIGEVVHVDHFGNLITNIRRQDFPSPEKFDVRIQLGNHQFNALSRTYSDVHAGEPLALIGSMGTLEIAVRDGSAARMLGGVRGDVVYLEMLPAL